MRISDWSSDVCSSDLNSLHPAMSVYRLGGGRERRANIEDPSRAVVMAFSRRCGVGEIRQMITRRRLRNRGNERSVIRQKQSSLDAISHSQLFKQLMTTPVDRVRRVTHHNQPNTE